MLREHALRFELPFLEPLLQLINLSPSHRSHQNSYKNARCYSFLNEDPVKAKRKPPISRMMHRSHRTLTLEKSLQKCTVLFRPGALSSERYDAVGSHWPNAEFPKMFCLFTGRIEG